MFGLVRQRSDEKIPSEILDALKHDFDHSASTLKDQNTNSGSRARARCFRVVYLVTHQKENSVFALKTVNLFRAEERERELAQAEIHLLRSLTHKHIVNYVSSYVKDNSFWIFTEYCEGGDLQHFLEDTEDDLPEALVVCWLCQCVLALEYLHGKGILHRDLKPANVYLSKDAEIRLGDLGVARILDNRKAMASTQVGTPVFMSPEVWCGEYNDKSDIWSLGCLTYELTMKQAALSGFHVGMLMYGLNVEVPVIGKAYSSQLRRLVQAMMSRMPDQRPSAAKLLRMTPVDQYQAKPEQPLSILRRCHVKTRWGTQDSAVDFAALMKKNGSLPLGFESKAISIPVEDLQTYKRRQLRRGKSADLRLVKRIKSEEEIEKDAVMDRVMEGLVGDSGTDESSSSSDDEDELFPSASTVCRNDEDDTKKLVQILRIECSSTIDEDILKQAFSIVDTERDPLQLESRLSQLIGQQAFNQHGHKIMYLRFLELSEGGH